MHKKAKGLPIWGKNFPKYVRPKWKKNFHLSTNLKKKKLFEDQVFSTELNSTERRTWKAFENDCSNFLSHEKLENCSEIVQELISSYSAVGCNMSLKLHFQCSHLGFFLKMREPSQMNMEKGSFRLFSKQNRGTVEKGGPNMLADYCWNLMWETKSGKYKRRKKTKWVFNEYFLVRILYINTLFFIWLYIS